MIMSVLAYDANHALHLHHHSSSWHRWKINSRDQVSAIICRLPLREIIMCIMLEIYDLRVVRDDAREFFYFDFSDAIKESSRFEICTWLILMSWSSVILFVSLYYIRSNWDILRPMLFYNSRQNLLYPFPSHIVEDVGKFVECIHIAIVDINFLVCRSFPVFLEMELESWAISCLEDICLLFRISFVDDVIPSGDEIFPYPVLDFDSFCSRFNNNCPLWCHSCKHQLAVLYLHQIWAQSIQLMTMILIGSLQIILEWKAESLTLQEFELILWIVAI